MLGQQVTHAAVGVIQREDGWVLLGQRPAGKPWAGWWEFPGGKIENGESAENALKRELHEELGITVTQLYPWLTRTFDYPEKTVKLHFFRVACWQGEPHGAEGQHLSWQNPMDLQVSPMLPANAPIIQALHLPSVYAITNLAELGEVAFFTKLKTALENGLRLIQIREKQLSPDALKAFTQQVMTLADPYCASVLVNADIALAQSVGASGVHFTSKQLMQLDKKPENLRCAASCHNAQELAKAAQLGLDFVVISPVLPTQSHADAQPLGWQNFRNLVRDFPVPVYALGGMQTQDLTAAWQHGAHGIAMQRGVW
ncbi:MAG TPA: Nudix family hydrolase [Methylotenera sp.]|nr:Nudix family hydrolase [Methylotenera sp.]HPH05550.1 Nudix family hydrolase [Methylotenera sp.]HPN00036.1 Nudix family hydrolase [Methylotenera sp.]